ncbi:hypothetical protein BV20DRAFT_255020 [Pilatotrama ljubarskyi]|nr:hypothetical protein BV20DRAFT_255020 [Pilatotrama ljubarskyi]
MLHEADIVRLNAIAESLAQLWQQNSVHRPGVSFRCTTSPETMPTMPSNSPRKTRSRSRLVSGSYDYEESVVDGSSAQASPATCLGYTTIPVMKASSMEPASGEHAGGEKRARHRINEFQLARLEELYRENTHPSRQAKEDLAREIGMCVYPARCFLSLMSPRRAAYALTTGCAQLLSSPGPSRAS